MHFYTALTALAAVLPALVHAHGDAPLPRIAGLNIADLKTRNIFDNLRTRAEAVAAELERPHPKRAEIKGRQSQEQCGPSFGSCAAGYCCSGSGWCGTSGDYCYAPGCNYQYGPGCPDNVVPAGTNTSSVARPVLGTVPYGGGGFYNCIKPGTIAITYDDGPVADYTAHVMDVFKSYGGKATFFITGNNINKGQIDVESNGHPAILRRMNSEGHQIASHTWTHQDLSAISASDRKNQMWKLEMAMRNVLGFFPTYMRPPYSSCTAASGCENDMKNLGYHVAYFDVDTDDYNQLSPEKIENSKRWFRGNITQGGATPANKQWLGIAHDIHYQTAYNLTESMLSTLTQLGYKAVTLGECLGDPKANWYRNSAGNTTPGTTTSRLPTSTSRTSTAPSSTASKKVSLDATCGSNNGGNTCLGSTFGNCCSVAGWCGATTAYCGEGCQTGYGTCGTNNVPSSSSSRPVTSSTRTSSATTPTGTLKVSTDGTCGTGITCRGSTFGNCCSQYGWCGATTDHCGTGCQTAFGTCGSSANTPSSSSVRPVSSSVRPVSSSVRPVTSSTRTSTATTPTGTLKVSTDGNCGTGVTCRGSTFGNCCSQYGWCGSTVDHCGTGCQRALGTCT